MSDNEDEKYSSGSEEEAKGNKESKGNDDKRYIDDIVKWKTQYKSAKEELEAIKLKSDSEKQELSSKFDSTAKEKSMFEQKYIEAEVKAHAVAAGIKDMEFVKLIDKGEIKLDEKGNIVGVNEAITALKTRKPDWFGSEKKTSSSTNADFANSSNKQPLDARSMSKDDWKKNKPSYMAGQF